MPRTPKVPSFRLHKPSGQAVVRLNGHDIYLGLHGTKVSRDEYDRVIGEWLANGRLPAVDETPTNISVMELLAAYLDYAESVYRKDGRPTGHLYKIRRVAGVIERLYGRHEVLDFGPRAFKAVREAFIQDGMARSTVNEHAAAVKALFRWGVASELIPSSIYEAIRTVEGLRRGRSRARETEPVKPVPVEHVDAIQLFVSRQVWALIQIQCLTGARSTEACLMRAVDIDMSGAVWLYRPCEHKTAHHGHDRVIYLGPRAQNVLKPFLIERPVDAFLFSPADAESERLEARYAARKTPIKYGNLQARTVPLHRGARQEIDTTRTAMHEQFSVLASKPAYPTGIPINCATVLQRNWQRSSESKWHASCSAKRGCLPKLLAVSGPASAQAN